MLQMVRVVDAQLAAVLLRPVHVQVQDHRVLPPLMIAKLVHMLFIKTPFLVQRIVKFITRYPRIARTVQVRHEGIHQQEETVLVRVIMGPVQPVDLVAAHRGVDGSMHLVAGARLLQLPLGIQPFQVTAQVPGQFFAQEMWGNAYMVVYKRVDEGIKKGFQ